MGNSVSVFLDLLVASQDATVRELWNRYFADLVKAASTHLVDPKHIASLGGVHSLSAVECLKSGAQQGRFAEMCERTQLWKLLIALTKRQAFDQLCQKSTLQSGDNSMHTVVHNNSTDSLSILQSIMCSTPTSEELAAIESETQRLLSILRDDVLRRVAVLKLSGYTNSQSADQLCIAPRSVERKLNLIQNTWTRQSQQHTEGPT